MLLVTYQPKGWKQRKPDVKYDEIKEILGIPHDKTIYWCIPANNIQQCFLRSLGATPWMPAKFIMFETEDYYNIDGIRWNRNIELPQDFPLTEEIRKVDYPDMAEYIVTELPEKIFEADLLPDAKGTESSMCVTLKQILHEKPEIYENYLQIIEQLANYQAVMHDKYGKKEIIENEQEFMKLRRHMISFQFTAILETWKYGKRLLQPDTETEENQELKKFTAKNFISKALFDIFNGYVKFWGTLAKEKAEDTDKLCQELHDYYDRAYRFCFHCNPYSKNYTGKNINPRMQCPCGSGKPYKKCCMKYPEMPDIIQKMSDGFEAERMVLPEMHDRTELPELPSEAVYRVVDIDTMHIVYIGSTKNLSSNTLKSILQRLEKVMFSKRRACVLQYFNGKIDKEKCIKTYLPSKNTIRIQHFHEVDMMNEEEQQNWMPVISANFYDGDLLGNYGGINTVLYMLKRIKETGFEQKKYCSYQCQRLENILWQEQEKIEKCKKNKVLEIKGNFPNGMPEYEIKPEFLEFIKNVYLDFCRFTNMTYQKNMFCYIPERNQKSSWFILRATDTIENKVVFLKAFSIPEKHDEQYSDYLYYLREAINCLDNLDYLIFDVFMADKLYADKESITKLLCRMHDYYQPVYAFADADVCEEPLTVKWHNVTLENFQNDMLTKCGGTLPNMHMIQNLKQTPYWQKIEKMEEYPEFAEFAEKHSLFQTDKIIGGNPDILPESVKSVLYAVSQKYGKLIEEKYRFMYSLRSKIS